MNCQIIVDFLDIQSGLYMFWMKVPLKILKNGMFLSQGMYHHSNGSKGSWSKVAPGQDLNSLGA